MTIAANFKGVHSGVMHAEEFYAVLMEARSPEFDEFDAHVVASILAISFGEAVEEGRPFTGATGLPYEHLNDLLAQVFPNAAPWPILALAVRLNGAPTKLAFSIC